MLDQYFNSEMKTKSIYNYFIYTKRLIIKYNLLFIVMNFLNFVISSKFLIYLNYMSQL